MTAGFNKNQDRTCFGLVFFTKQITAPPQLSKGWSRMKVDDLSLWMGVESNYCLPALGAFTIRRSQAALHSGHAPGGGGADEGRGVRRLHIVHSGSKWLKAAQNKFGWCDFTNFFKLILEDLHHFRFRWLHLLHIKNLSNWWSVDFQYIWMWFH